MKIINRDLAAEKDGVPGYLAHPDRKEAGPAVMIVHHHFGVTGNMKVNVCNYAKLGYTTLVPDLYKMLGEADGVHEAQKKTSDGRFNEILTSAWRYLTSRPDVDGKRCAVVGYCMGGLLALALAARRRRQVRALALLPPPWSFPAERAGHARLMGAPPEPPPLPGSPDRHSARRAR